MVPAGGVTALFGLRNFRAPPKQELPQGLGQHAPSTVSSGCPENRGGEFAGYQM
jgi:hypothetical protein